MKNPSLPTYYSGGIPGGGFQAKTNYILIGPLCNHVCSLLGEGLGKITTSKLPRVTIFGHDAHKLKL